jgi:hypothetical protein
LPEISAILAWAEHLIRTSQRMHVAAPAPRYRELLSKHPVLLQKNHVRAAFRRTPGSQHSTCSTANYHNLAHLSSTH